jgi:hypothetical protein
MARGLLEEDQVPVGRPMMTDDFQAIMGQSVNFRLSDVHVPEPHEVLGELHHDEILQGIVVDVSAGPEGDSGFLVVKVDGLTSLLVVPRAKIMDVS